jgi:type IV pilus assembly protein PilE
MDAGNRGFTLTELLVTVAIVGTLTAVAVPSYRQYVMRASRADATAALLRIAGNQERFYLQNNTYASDDLLDDAPPDGLGFGGTERGLYEITLDPNGGGYQNGFIVTATAVADGPQEEDEDCQTFTLNEQGLRWGGTGSTDNTETCWR